MLLVAALLAAAVGCSGEPSGDHPRESRSSGTGSHAPPEAGGDTGRPEQGPYEVRTRTVPASDVDGRFRGGTIHYPDGEGEGKGDGGKNLGVIAASPGLGAEESMVTPYGKLLASHGFVVITFDTRTLEDSPAQRGRQLLHALDYVTERSPLADRTDPDRLGVMGHSMGGGGALFAASRDRDIKAVVPLTPYAEQQDPPKLKAVKAPTLVVGGSSDEIAPVPQHAEAFYEGLSAAKEKEYLELRGDHFVATPPGRLVAAQVVAWFERFLDDDRGSGPDSGSGPGPAASLCPPPHDALVTESRDTCPYG